MGGISEAIGDLENAFKYYGQSLTLKEKCLSENHKSYQATLFNLAESYAKESKVDEMKNCLILLQKLE